MPIETQAVGTRTVSLPTRNPFLFEALLRENQLASAAIRHFQAQQMTETNRTHLDKSMYLGQHLLAEFTVRSVQLNSNQFEKLIRDAAILSGATILCSRFFQNKINGNISGIVVIEESHFSVHYLRDQNFIALDAYTCGHINLNAAVEHIKLKLRESPYDKIEFKRGIRKKDEDAFIPGIALLRGSTLGFFSPGKQLNNASLGQHVVAEFYYCDPGRINSSEFVLNHFRESLEANALPIKFNYVHQFQPQGISAVIIGNGYHLTVHDWPEHAYAAMDLCVFDDKVEPQKIMLSLAEEFQSQKAVCYQFPRGSYEGHHRQLQPVFPLLEARQQAEPIYYGPQLK